MKSSPSTACSESRRGDGAFLESLPNYLDRSHTMSVGSVRDRCRHKRVRSLRCAGVLRAHPAIGPTAAAGRGAYHRQFAADRRLEVIDHRRAPQEVNPCATLHRETESCVRVIARDSLDNARGKAGE